MEDSHAFFASFWREFQQLANKPGSNLLPSAVTLGKQLCVALASDGDGFLAPRDWEDKTGWEAAHPHNPERRTSSFYCCDTFANPTTTGLALEKLLFLHCYPRGWEKIANDRRGDGGLVHLLLFPWLDNRVSSNARCPTASGWMDGWMMTH